MTNDEREERLNRYRALSLVELLKIRFYGEYERSTIEEVNLEKADSNEWKDLVNKILESTVANLGTEGEFYICQTFQSTIPEWATKAKRMLDEK